VAERYKVEIDDGWTVEHPFGWVFFYNTKEYIEGDRNAGLVGNAAIIVDRHSGKPSRAGTSYPIEWLIHAYEVLGQERFDAGEWGDFIDREYIAKEDEEAEKELREHERALKTWLASLRSRKWATSDDASNVSRRLVVRDVYRLDDRSEHGITLFFGAVIGDLKETLMPAIVEIQVDGTPLGEIHLTEERVPASGPKELRSVITRDDVDIDRLRRGECVLVFRPPRMETS
jgi:hypothetical protein